MINAKNVPSSVSQEIPFLVFVFVIIYGTRCNNPAKLSFSSYEDANLARLTSVSSQVRVVNVLIPLQSPPDAESVNYLLSLPRSTTLEITTFPICIPLLGGVNLWRGVRAESGLEGWPVEESAVNDIYYLQEMQ